MWIADGVTIYSGVIIGDGAVIAGQSVVTKDVPPYALIAGNPAVIKKYRFEPSQIVELMRLQWWNFPIECIKTRLMPVIHLGINEFIAVANQIVAEKNTIHKRLRNEEECDQVRDWIPGVTH